MKGFYNIISQTNTDFLKKYAHRLLYVFYPFRTESQLLTGNPPSCKNKLSDTVVMKVVKQDKIKFETFGDIVRKTFASFNQRSLIK